jgi:hypothetical protein
MINAVNKRHTVAQGPRHKPHKLANIQPAQMCVSVCLRQFAGVHDVQVSLGTKVKRKEPGARVTVRVVVK